MRIFLVGLTSKKLLVFLSLLFLAGMVFALPLDLKLPVFTGNNLIVDQINQAMETYFNGYRDEIKTALDFLPDNVNNLAGGFVNASVFSNDGASQRGYGGYNAFSFTTGFMLAAQVPLGKIMDLYNNSKKEGIGPNFVKDVVEIPFGIDGKLTAQLGINTSFLLKGLYLGFEFSMFDTNWMKSIPSDFSFKTMSVGINASYQLISQKRLLAGLFVWRGLNLGTGFIWQNTSFGWKSDSIMTDLIGEDLRNIPVPISIPSPFGDIDYNINMPIDGSLYLGLYTSAYIIPVKAMTSLRLLGILNVALGAGCDIAFGRSDIKAACSITVDKDKVNAGLPNELNIRMDEAPSLTLNLPGTSLSNFLNPKFMGAVGFNFGPVIIDIPVTYYLNNGYSLGITLGLSF